MRLFQGEDVIACADTEGRDLQALAAAFRQSGHWEEVVPGMADLTVKFDPLTMSGEQAEVRFRALWDGPVAADETDIEEALLDADFGQAPDAVGVASALGLTADALPDWLCSRSYRVTMMGFQPGFAYLEDMGDDDLPTLPRLTTPRQYVAAGSMGFLGKRACIYALDGPGGWPIVGRVSEPLFRPDNMQPFLLQPGQVIRFRGS